MKIKCSTCGKEGDIPDNIYQLLYQKFISLNPVKKNGCEMFLECPVCLARRAFKQTQINCLNIPSPTDTRTREEILNLKTITFENRIIQYNDGYIYHKDKSASIRYGVPIVPIEQQLQQWSEWELITKNF